MICLHHNAATPVLPEPRRGFLRSSFFLHHSSFSEEWGNPSSACKFGSKLKGVIDTARAQVAELIGAQPREIIFTPRAARGTNAAIHTALTCLGEIDIIA